MNSATGGRVCASAASRPIASPKIAPVALRCQGPAQPGIGFVRSSTPPVRWSLNPDGGLAAGHARRAGIRLREMGLAAHIESPCG